MAMFLTRMPAGIPGVVTRVEGARIEQKLMDTNYPVTKYGLPVKFVGGKIRPMAENNTGQPDGFLVKAYPTQRTANEALGTAVPDPTTGQPFDVLVAGYIMANVPSGTVTADTAVAYRAVQSSPAVLIGRLEAGLSGSPETNVVIQRCRFIGTADANGNVEIAFNV